MNILKKYFYSHSSKSGQATVELIPCLLIFFIIISAGLVYFKFMRFATIQQEVARNLAFAKINNSGTLTLSAQAGTSTSGSRPQPYISVEGGANGVPVANDEVTRNTQCFSVKPLGSDLPDIDLGNIFGIKSMLGDQKQRVFTQAVVYRFPGSGCSN